MPDEPQQDSGRDGQQQNNNDSQQVEVGGYQFASLDEAASIIGALSKRVGERDDKINNLSERLSEIEAARKKQLEQSGNFEQIAKERMAELDALKPVAERAKALEDVIRQSNERRIEELPENWRSAVPTEYPPEKLQQWLNENQNLLTKPTAPDSNAGAGRGGGRSGQTQQPLTDEERQIAARMGISEENYRKAKDAMGG